MRDPRRKWQALGDRGRRHRVGRRHDRTERERRSQRQRRQQPMHQIADDDDRRGHEAEGEQQDRAQIAHELALRKQPAIAEEQRRNEQQEKDIGIEAHRGERRHERQQHAARSQNDRQRQRNPLGHCTERGDHDEQDQRKLDCVHVSEPRRADQNVDPGVVRNATSSGVDARPRMTLRCGKRPKRRITSA